MTEIKRSERYLFAILSPRGIERLDEIGRVAEEEGVTRRPADHTQHRQPHVSQRLRRESPVSYAQHVRHGLEQGPRILLQPEGVLSHNFILVYCPNC